MGFWINFWYLQLINFSVVFITFVSVNRQVLTHRYRILNNLWLEMTAVLLEFKQFGLPSLIIGLDVDVYSLFFTSWSQDFVCFLKYLICLLKQFINLIWCLIWWIIQNIWLKWNTIRWGMYFTYLSICMRKAILKCYI